MTNLTPQQAKWGSYLWNIIIGKQTRQRLEHIKDQSLRIHGIHNSIE